MLALFDETLKSSPSSIVEESFAKKLDSVDPLASFRNQFIFPPFHEPPTFSPEHYQPSNTTYTSSSTTVSSSTSSTSTSTETDTTNPTSKIYLCGNSLGLQPKRLRSYVNEELDKWEIYGVEGHVKPIRPWLTVDETVNESSCRIVGGLPHEVVIMNSLTVNLHLLMVGFYQPNNPNVLPKGRYKILIEDHAFPSDTYAVKSQLLYHQQNINDALLLVKPREGEECIREEDILQIINDNKDTLALVLLCGVQYYTGQVFNIPKITAAAHSVGAYCGWDLAHAVGNIPLKLHEWNVDFAAWCTYKYLNSGPGGLSGAFLHEKYRSDTLEKRPHFAGWWGHRKHDRFKMGPDFTPIDGVQGWQLSNPPVLPIAALRASLDIFDEAGGVEKLRQKSLGLTSYLEYLIYHFIPKDEIRIFTPADREARGAQLSLSFTLPVRQIFNQLTDAGIVVDMREPYVIRVAPAPLYNNAQDVYQFVTFLKKIIENIRAKETK